MMLPRPPWIAVPVFLALATGAGADEPPAPAIRDQAGLLTTAGAQKADEEARAIRDIYQVPIVVETVEAPPDDVKKRLQAAKDNAQKVQILHDWAERRAADDPATGDAVHVLLCKDVARGWFGLRQYGCVVVTVPADLLDRSFTAADARALHDRLTWFNMGQDREKNDRLLMTALIRLRDHLAAKQRPGFPWAAVGGVFAGALVVWLVLVVVRSRLASGQPGEPRRPGLYHALLGGMFGTPAAHWVYDTLFVAASHRAAPAPGPSVAAAPATPPEETRAPSESVQSGPPTQTERLDLAARDHLADDGPTKPTPTRF